MLDRRTLLLSAALLQGLSLTSAAQQLEEIVVSGTRLEETIPLDLRRYGNQVEIITAEQIQEGGFVDIAQSLQMLVPGLHVTPKNGPYDYVNASLQGSRKQEILWLVDGVRITNRLYNGTSPLDTLPPHMVERIEVLKGGQGIFYGTQSVGGVINIVTKSFQQEADGAVSVTANSNDGRGVNGYFRGGNARHEFVVFASHDEADGYTPFKRKHIQPSATDLDRGYDVQSLGFKYALNISPDSRLSLQVQRNEAELDWARPFRNYKTFNEREETIATLKYDLRLSDNLELYVKAYRHTWDTHYTQIYNELDGSGGLTGGRLVINDGDYWGYEDYGFNAMVKYNGGKGLEYIVGFDQQNFSGEDDVWRIADQKEKVNAPFVQVRTTEDLWDSTLLALGVRHNKASKQENSTVWNLTGRHQLNDDWFVQANIGTAFRSPDAEALFLNELDDLNNDGIPDGGWFAIGNPDLKPEKSENLNISFGGSPLPGLHLELTYFDRKVKDYILSYVPVFIGGVEGESFRNSDEEVDVRGFELLLRADLSSSWSGQFSVSNTKAELKSGGPQLDDIPEWEAKAQLRYQQPGSPLSLSLSSIFVKDARSRGVELDDYAVVDAAASYRFGGDQNHLVFFRVENLFDKEYTTGLGTATSDLTGDSYLYDNLGMERTFHLGYSYSF